MERTVGSKVGETEVKARVVLPVLGGWGPPPVAVPAPPNKSMDRKVTGSRELFDDGR